MDVADSFIVDAGAIAASVTAILVAFGALARLRPLRWLVGQLVGKPVGEWLSSLVAEEVKPLRAEIKHLRGEVKESAVDLAEHVVDEIAEHVADRADRDARQVALDERLATIDQRLDDGAARFDELEAKLDRVLDGEGNGT